MAKSGGKGTPMGRLGKTAKKVARFEWLETGVEGCIFRAAVAVEIEKG